MASHRHLARRQMWAVACVLVVAACVCWAAPGVARAVELPVQLWQAPEDGNLGEGAGQLGLAGGVAVDPLDGHVFVADPRDLRVVELTSWGGFVKAFGWGVADGVSQELQTCTSVCFRGLEGGAAGEIKNAEGLKIAVGSEGDVYVSEPGNLRVQKFDPHAGSGVKEVAFVWALGADVDQAKVETAGSSESERDLCTAVSKDVCQSGVVGTGQGQFDLPGFGGVYRGLPVTASSSGDLFVGDRGDEGGVRGRVQEFDSNGGFVSQFELPKSPESVDEEEYADEPGALAFDPSSGDLYFAFLQREAGKTPQPDVYKLNASGSLLGKLEVSVPEAIAVDVRGDLFAVEGFRLEAHLAREVVEFDPSGRVVIGVGSHLAEPENSKNAVLPGLAVGTLAPGSGTPGDLYVADDDFSKSKAFVSAYGPPEEFESPPLVAPAIGDQYAVSVDPEDASLEARINPFFWRDATYYVEYGTGKCSEGGCVSTSPVPPGGLLTSKQLRAPLGAPALLSGLSPGTVYHYRFVAQSGGSEGQPARGVGGRPGVDGEEGVFRTPSAVSSGVDGCSNSVFRTGVAALLPDCRAYEMVSPVEKGNGDVIALVGGLKFRARLDESAVSGEALSYSSYRAFGDTPGGGWSDQYLARRGATGWTTKSISSPISSNEVPGAILNDRLDTFFNAFSPDLSSAWLTDPVAPNPDPSAPGGFTNIFRYDSTAGGFEGQIRATPPHDNGNEGHYPELEGVSVDGEHAVFRMEDNLTADAPELGSGRYQLYEAFREGGSAAQLRLVSLLPGEVPAGGGASVGTGHGGSTESHEDRYASVLHAVSDDGSRVYWTAANTGPGRVYVRVNGVETLPVSEAVSPVDTSAAEFWGASDDGSRALYVYRAGSKAGDLYEYDLETGKATRVAHKATGFLGASDDLSYVYFVSGEAIAGAQANGDGEAPVADQANLYVDHEGEFVFIARLSVADMEGVGTYTRHDSPVNSTLFWHAARVSDDGKGLVFMSSSGELAQKVAVYDNTDRVNGRADAEVYHYDAGSGVLVCASCNPTGARPHGSVMESISDKGVSAASALPNPDSALYQPRYLSEDGSRLFFNSFEGLLPRDSNTFEDVYEWEAVGAGPEQDRCTEASPSYSSPNGGCLSLISTGQSSHDSEFIDASTDGRDVFFSTLSSLVPQDPGLIDIYDAREGGGIASTETLGSGCEGEACQSVVSPPNDLTPGSAAFSGPGNLVAPLSSTAGSGQQQSKRKAVPTRAQRLASALRACKRKPKAKRKACERAARKRYGKSPKGASARTRTNKGGGR